MNQTVDFGYQQVPQEEKARRVGEVFSSVAARYDLMNDLMSFGIHRVWKRLCIHLAGLRPGSRVLDLAAGTGDLAARLQQAGYEVIACDINEAMLRYGRDKLVDRGLLRDVHYVQADAERLPFADNSFACATLAFGLRNMTDKPAALRAIHAGLKYGGQVLILEFSQVTSDLFRQVYDAYSFHAIPALGKLVLQDPDSYRYLVESIRMHPDQDSLKTMLEQAGFSRVDYLNLSGGIVALHRGFKL